MGIRRIGKPVHGGGDTTVIFQGSHRGTGKGCGRPVGCVGAAAKVRGWRGLRRACLAQEEKEWWRVGNLRVRSVKRYRRRRIFLGQRFNEGMGDWIAREEWRMWKDAARKRTVELV